MERHIYIGALSGAAGAFAVLLAMWTLLGVSGIVLGQADNDVINACAGRSIRLVDSEDDCRKNEEFVSWNREGPQGPAGPAGSQGPAGPAGPPGSLSCEDYFRIQLAVSEFPDLRDCGDPPECVDGFDNDNDGPRDFPDDAGCDSYLDDDESGPITECRDGIDNDGDGFIDRDGLWVDPIDPSSYVLPDPGCDSLLDNSEHSDGLPCDNGADEDADGLSDFPADPGCTSLEDMSEFGGHCDDDSFEENDGTFEFVERETEHRARLCPDDIDRFHVPGDPYNPLGEIAVHFNFDPALGNLNLTLSYLVHQCKRFVCSDVLVDVEVGGPTGAAAFVLPDQDIWLTITAADHTVTNHYTIEVNSLP